MAFFIIVLQLLCLCSVNASNALTKAQALYLIHKQDPQQAFELYFKQGVEDRELLEQMCIQLIESGMRKEDSETNMLSVFGAGISNYAPLVSVLQKGMRSSDANMQMMSLHFLGSNFDDRCHEVIKQGLTSPYLGMRLETLLKLAIKHDPSCIDHLFALTGKIPPPVITLLPSIAARIDHPKAKSFLAYLLQDFPDDVKRETVIQAALHHRDDLATEIKTIAKQSSGILQESALFALAYLGHHDILDFILQAHFKKPECLSLSYALCLLGEKRFEYNLIEAAKNKDLFAIALMGQTQMNDQRKEILYALLKDHSKEVSLNAAYSLAKHKDPAGIELLQQALVKKGIQAPLCFTSNPAKTMSALHNIAITHLKNTELQLALQKISQTKIEIIETISLLSENYLIETAQLLHQEQEFDLFAVAAKYLAHCSNPESIECLQSLYQTTGSEITKLRLSHLLYQVTGDQKIENEILTWIKKRCNYNLFSFQTSAEHQKGHFFSLTPSETSELLVSAFETLAQRYSTKALEALVYAMAYGHEKNRYALAGLTLRMLE